MADLSTNQGKLDYLVEAGKRIFGILPQRYEKDENGNDDLSRPARVFDNLDGAYLHSSLSGQLAGLYTVIGQLAGGGGTIDLEAIRKASEEGAAKGASEALDNLRIVSGGEG